MLNIVLAVGNYEAEYMKNLCPQHPTKRNVGGVSLKGV
jgi:hypothetical protein